jgi:hypothetical protein
MAQNQQHMQQQQRFTMPHVEIGDMVIWYPDGVRANNSEEMAHAAIVTKIGYDSLNLNVCSPSSYNFMIRDGVRHLDDPKAVHPDLRSQGGWDFTPATKRLKLMEKRLQLALEALARGGDKQAAELLAKELELKRAAKATADAR